MAMQNLIKTEGLFYVITYSSNENKNNESRVYSFSRNFMPV